MSQQQTSTTGGTSIVGLLGVAFVVLKLCHVIDWPWVWVLAPFWIPLAIAIPLIVLFAILAVVVGGSPSTRGRRW